MPSGALPVVIPLTSPQDEATRVINEIRELVQAGVPLGHILMIHADWRETGKLIGRLKGEFGPEAAVDPGQSAAGANICGRRAQIASRAHSRNRPKVRYKLSQGNRLLNAAGWKRGS